MPYRKTIADAYDAGVKEEYFRLTENPLREVEYRLIIELIDEYVPEGSLIIDIGSGPGRYAEHLLQRNCKVGVVDLSAKSLKAFSSRMKKSLFSDNIIFNRVSCATNLSWIADSSANAVLLMGPLYHLVDEGHRNETLVHCNRILKSGGLLFSVFLSPFPVLIPDMNYECEDSLCSINDMFSRKCNLTYTLFQGYEVPQFRCWPGEARKMMRKNNFSTIRIRNIEGTGLFISGDKLSKISSPEEKTNLLNNLRRTSEIGNKLGITQQYIVVGKKQ